MSEGSASERALDALREVRADKFPDVPEDLLIGIFELEQAEQFESERGPIEAKLRDLIMGWEEK